MEVLSLVSDIYGFLCGWRIVNGGVCRGSSGGRIGTATLIALSRKVCLDQYVSFLAPGFTILSSLLAGRDRGCVSWEHD